VKPRFEKKFVTQGSYETRDIFISLDTAWGLLRTFPQYMLKRIPEKTLKEYYHRRSAAGGATEATTPKE